MSTEGRPKTSTAQPLLEQQQQRRQNQSAYSTFKSDQEILIKLKNLGLEDQLSLSLLAEFKRLRIKDRPYFSPPVRAPPSTQHFILIANSQPFTRPSKRGQRLGARSTAGTGVPAGTTVSIRTLDPCRPPSLLGQSVPANDLPLPLNEVWDAQSWSIWLGNASQIL